jgi:hypothetical protein
MDQKRRKISIIEKFTSQCLSSDFMTWAMSQIVETIFDKVITFVVSTIVPKIYVLVSFFCVWIVL